MHLVNDFLSKYFLPLLLQETVNPVEFCSDSSFVVSLLTFGTGGRFGRLSAPLAQKLVDHAVSSGIKVFDTGFEYCSGASQKLLFKSLSRHLYANTCDIKLSTKFRLPLHFGELTENVNETLSLLPSRGYIDTLFLWGPSIADLTNSFIWDELNMLKQSGKIMRYGVNTHDYIVLSHLHESQKNICLDDIMLDYNLLQLDREILINSFAHSGVKVWAGTALCQGFLNQSLFDMVRRTRSFSYLARALFNPSTFRFLAPARKLRNFIRFKFPQYCESIPLSFVLQNSSVSFVPVGMLSCSSITSNLQILSNLVPIAILETVSSWAKLNCQVSD